MVRERLVVGHDLSQADSNRHDPSLPFRRVHPDRTMMRDAGAGLTDIQGLASVPCEPSAPTGAPTVPRQARPAPRLTEADWLVVASDRGCCGSSGCSYVITSGPFHQPRNRTKCHSKSTLRTGPPWSGGSSAPNQVYADESGRPDAPLSSDSIYGADHGLRARPCIVATAASNGVRPAHY